MREKRRSPRFIADGPNTCLVEFPDVDASGRLSNLSRSGLAFRLPRQLRERAAYDFNIRVGGRPQLIPCRARIVWVRTDEETQSCFCGAKIEKMDNAEKVELLDQFYEVWRQKAADVF